MSNVILATVGDVLSGGALVDQHGRNWRLATPIINAADVTADTDPNQRCRWVENVSVPASVVHEWNEILREAKPGQGASGTPVYNNLDEVPVFVMNEFKGVPGWMAEGNVTSPIMKGVYGERPFILFSLKIFHAQKGQEVKYTRQVIGQSLTASDITIWDQWDRGGMEGALLESKDELKPLGLDTTIIRSIVGGYQPAVALTQIIQRAYQKPKELSAGGNDRNINASHDQQQTTGVNSDLSTSDRFEKAKTDLETVSFDEMIRQCQDAQPEVVKKLVCFYPKNVDVKVLLEQFDLVKPVLNKIANLEGGKEVIKAFLDHLIRKKDNLLEVPELFKKVMAFIDALPLDRGKPYFITTELKDILTTRNENDNCYYRNMAIDQPKIFAAAMPWLKRIADEPNGGREMLVKLLTQPHAFRKRTPLHFSENVPHVIQLLERLQPAVTDAELRPLLLAKMEVHYPGDLFPSRERGTITDKVPLCHVPLFLYVAPRLCKFIQENDREMIKFIINFMRAAGDFTQETINLLDPAVFTAAKPLIEELAKANCLTLGLIDRFFTRSYLSEGWSPFARKEGTPAAPLFNLENLKWSLSLIEQVKEDKQGVYKMFKRYRNETDRTVLHTPGALAIVKPYLPVLTLWKKLKLLFEAGSETTTMTWAKSLAQEKFYPAPVTIFERNLEEAKKWIEESSPTADDIVQINRCIQTWIAADPSKREERTQLVASWTLLQIK